MPLAPVNNNGVSLYYDDSGAPAGSTTYKTLVFIHGGIFNGGVFQRVASNAARNNLRVVSVNHRDVLPSTAFTSEELQVFKTNDRKAHEAWLGDRLLEWVKFLAYFVEKEKIPIYDEQEGTGGLSFMSWSLGNNYAIPLLGSIDTSFPSDKTGLLAKYIRSFVLFDPPYYAIGEPEPPYELLYNPLADPLLSSDSLSTTFVPWSAAYFIHSPKIVSSFSPTASLDTIPSREEILKQGLLGSKPDSEPSPTTDRIPPETIKSLTWSSGKESERDPSDPLPLITSLSPDMYRSFSDRAFSTAAKSANENKDTLKLIWPRAKVNVLVCERSMPICIHANLELKRRILEAERDGLRVPGESRDVKFWLLEGYNHHPHWDDPETFTKFLAGIL
ncbi:hypothetical protein ABKN59_007561 [Abortiporus biennis]